MAAALLLAALLGSGMGAGAEAAAAWSFQNVTAQRVDKLPDSTYRFDALWTDFNGDGCYDPFIFAHSDLATSRLWLNSCDGSNTFTLADNAAVRYYIATPTWPRGSGWVSLLDFNGDGKQDFWTRDAVAKAARYVNGSAAGGHVPRFEGKQYACSDHCVFGDIDGDGALDIIHPDRRVETMRERRTLHPATGTAAEVIVADVDGDDWPDILQPALGGYWHNGKGKLTWRDTVFAGEPVQYAIADFDNDGNMDVLLFTEHEHASGELRLYRNDGEGHFVDVSADSGLAAVPYNPYWTGYGNMVAADFDNDGLPDLLIAGAGRQPSVLLLRNLGGLRFAAMDVDLGAAGHGSEAFKSRASVADFDNDGRLDIVKTQDRSNLGIWRNTTDTDGRHWLKVRVRGTGENSDGVGATVRVSDPTSGALLAHLMVQVGPQHPQTWLHTGVGAHATVDVEVRFPHDGPTYRFDGITADQELIVFATGCLIQGWQPGQGWPLTAPAGCAVTCDKPPVAAATPVSRSHRAARSGVAAEAGREGAVAGRSASPPAVNPDCGD